MASNVTTQSVFSNITMDQVVCSICTNHFRQPKVLDCLHTFCLDCLQNLRQSPDLNSNKLTCPRCARETILNGSGITDLPDNFAFSALVEEVAMQDKLLQGLGSGITCQACDEGNQAISRCMECDHFLCQECQRAHGRMTLMKSHRIYTLAQLRSGKITYKSKLREMIPKCREHPDQNVSVYCNTCLQVICTTCSVLNHPLHSVTALTDALEECQSIVAELVAKVQESKTELSSILRETCESHKALNAVFADTKRKIKKKADQEVAKIQKKISEIRQEEQTLLEETQQIYKERLKLFETVQTYNRTEVTQVEHRLDEVKRLMDQASCYEILELQQKLLVNLNELTWAKPKRVSDKLTFLDFEEGEKALGNLVLEEPGSAAKESPGPCQSLLREIHVWELKTEINNFKGKNAIIAHISTFSNNTILALQSTNQTFFTISSSTRPNESPPDPQRLQIKGLTKTRCIAVNDDDKLIGLCGSCVKVFDAQHQLLHQFKPAIGLDQPTCLAVDGSNLIAVGYEERSEISLHKLNGSLIRRLPAPMIECYLATYKQWLIYTTYWAKRLICIDYQGFTVFSTDMTDDILEGGHPTGVCCDTDGSIYVGVSRFPAGDVLHYSPDGKYIGYIITGCIAPCDITLTSDGQLVVAAGGSVRIYHRV
ncbi:E3 ubiquitin-protein ligase TRIM71-like [Acanthaster planci]|uniref:E3 ubiquitin-protein ligase TRIM71-like n=1 Tax=Acanthaster planci TaxID=133434 RepID=A0A8B7ZIA8_ACAPL|nr:E3 ubiquitin-protein ligase TRIM71-like [Acanthaster planci]